MQQGTPTAATPVPQPSLAPPPPPSSSSGTRVVDLNPTADAANALAQATALVDKVERDLLALLDRCQAAYTDADVAPAPGECPTPPPDKSSSSQLIPQRTRRLDHAPQFPLQLDLAPLPLRPRRIRTTPFPRRRRRRVDHTLASPARSSEREVPNPVQAITGRQGTRRNCSSRVGEVMRVERKTGGTATSPPARVMSRRASQPRH